MRKNTVLKNAGPPKKGGLNAGGGTTKFVGGHAKASGTPKQHGGLKK